MKNLLTIAMISLMIAGCAALGPAEVAKLRQDAKTIAFVQNGTEPASYLIGSVDGKTFWAGGGTGNTTFVPANSNSKADVNMSGQANAVMAVGKLIASAAMSDDPEYYHRIAKNLIEGKAMAKSVGELVLPELGRAWGIPYNPALLHTIDGFPIAESREGVASDRMPPADLVLMYTMDSVFITEKPSLNVFKHVLLAGMGDRDVIPMIDGHMTVLKRDASGQLKLVWKLNCLFYAVSNDAIVPEKFSVIAETPEKAKPMLDASVTVGAASCKKMLDRGFS